METETTMKIQEFKENTQKIKQRNKDRNNEQHIGNVKHIENRTRK